MGENIGTGTCVILVIFDLHATGWFFFATTTHAGVSQLA